MDPDRVSGTVNEVKGDVKEGIGKFTGDAKTQAEGMAESMAGKAQQTVGQARDALRDAADVVSEQAASVGEYLDETIRDRPLTALLAAGAVGYVLSLLIHRR